MPFYEFECDTCRGRTERLLPMHSSKPVLCECGGALSQVFTSPFAIFMGKVPISFHRKFAYPHHDAKKP